MPWKLGSRRIAYDVPFTNEGTGVQYPANWMRLSNERDKQAIGMVWEEPEAKNTDQRFYWSAGNPKQLDDVTDDDGNTTTGLKTLWKANQSQIAGTLIAPSDWRVIKAKETGSNMPAAWKTYRAAVRTACNTRQTEIDNCSDVAALKELLFGSATIERQQTDSEGNGVVDDDGNAVMETVANPNIATAWPDTIE
jgi:hypothetical protein|tara:strand:+ start:43 stop:624 length:582 start_codon:yes stop_codon:yes gene_type:complete